MSNSIKKPDSQDLDLYWDDEMAAILETWGESHVWKEIQLLLWNSHGKVLDIACGTGITMKILESIPAVDVHGCDISDLLIEKAIGKGISKDRLKVADATNLENYQDNEFVHCYSIGSLEHFTDDGIDSFIAESRRVTSGAGFHMIPVSRKDEDEGWLKTYQSFFNNSKGWWETKFRQSFDEVVILPSGWEDDISVGVWVICR